MGWKLLFAVFLVLLIVWLVTYDERAKKQVVEWKDIAVNMMPVAPTVPTPTVSTAPTPTAAPAAPEPAPKKEGFCPKLGQKYGFCDAGAR